MKCVYMILNIRNDKKYIGSSANFARRVQDHKSYLKRNAHQSIRLQRSWNKYGEDSFIFVPLVIVDDTNDLLPNEQRLIDELDVTNPLKGYNTSKIAGRPENTNHIPVIQFSFSGELIKKFSSAAEAGLFLECSGSGINAACSGKYRFYKNFIWIKESEFSEELLQKKILLAKNPIKRTEETRKKQSLLKIGRKLSEEHKKKLSEKHKGVSPKNLDSLHKMSRKGVSVYNKVSGDLIKTFESVSACCKEYPGCQYQISGKAKNPKKFIFKYS